VLFHFLLLWLVYDGGHDVRKYPKLIEIPHFHPYVEGHLYVLLVQFKDKSHPFHGISHELWQIIVEVLIYYLEVIFKVGGEHLELKEYFLEVLLDERKNPYQLYISEPWHDIISYRVVLVPYQQRKFDVKPFHNLPVFGATVFWCLQFDLPMREHPFDQEVQADEKVDHLVVVFV